MHILEFKAYYKPEVAAGIELDANTAEDLAAAGHYVHLHIPAPSRGVAREIAKATPRKENLVEGRLRIRRYGMYREGKRFPQRLLRYGFCCLKQLWHGLWEKKVDLIFAGSTPPFQGLVCKLLKKIKKIPFVFNCQDIFPDSMVTAGMIGKDSTLCRVGNWISDVTYRAADKIIVISENMKETLINRGVPAEKIAVVYNWVDENVIHPVKKADNALMHQLQIPEDAFTVVYAGNLGYAQAIDVILDAAVMLKNAENIRFVIFGNGAMEQEVPQILQDKQLHNVSLYPLQPQERVSEVYSMGDACIVSCKEGTGSFAMPSKTWSIMGCGRPVLASFDPDTLLEEIVSNHGCGLFSRAGDGEALAENIRKLAQNPGACQSMGKNARTYIEENLTRKKCTKDIIDLIEQTERAWKSDESIVH